MLGLRPVVRVPLHAALVLLTCLFTSAEADSITPRSLVLLGPIDVAQTRALVGTMSRDGAHVEHVVPGRALIGRFGPAALASLASHPEVVSVHPEGSTPELAEPDPILAGVVRAWEIMTGLRQAESAPAGPPLAGDAAHPPSGDEETPASGFVPPGAELQDTSEFLLGSTTLVVLLPESDGSIDPNQEDWTALEETTVTAEVMNGMEWWIARGADIGHPMSFSYDFRFGLNQPYEPITRHSDDHVLWVGAIIDSLGYTALGTLHNNVHDFLNDERDAFGTNWAVATFVVDDTVDPDDNFTGGYFAFSYYGGPFYWMTYGNAGWGSANMDMIAAHELGHSFYAFDEYPSSGCICTESMGYLNGKNQNCSNGCADTISTCIMNSGTVPVEDNVLEFNSAKQVGLLDADVDSIPNILDTDPVTVLDPFGADTTGDDTPTYTGTAAVTTKDNKNTTGLRNDITLNLISLVEYRVDAGTWTAASPLDAAFDDSLELFEFTTATLGEGLHVIEARAHHSYGNVDLTPAIDTLFVQTASSVPPGGIGSARLSAAPSPFSDRIVLRFGAAAATTYRLSAYTPEGRLVARLRDGAIASGAQAVVWDGRLADGSHAPAGVYLFRLQTPGRMETARAVLLR